MKIVFLLCMCVMSCAATCLTTLGIRDRDLASLFPGRLVKWNRQIRDFELIEAFNQNFTSLCTVDYIDDLTGKTVVISGEVLLPYLQLNPDKTLTGYIGDIWTTLETALKFRTDFRKARFSVGEMLMRGEVDEWLAAIAMTVRNNGHMVYSHQIASTSYSLYMPSEDNGVPKWWYMNIFAQDLWAMSVCFIIGIAALLFVMYRLKTVVCQNYEECNNQLAIPSFNLLSVLGVMTGQGFQEIPNAWSLRFTILSAVIMGMLISCGFSSTLTSYLAIRGNTVHFNNLDDIVRAKTHSLCVRNVSNAYAKLGAMATKDKTNNWKHIINKNCPNMADAKEFGQHLCRPGFVYVEAPDVFLSVYAPIHYTCIIAQISGEHWSSKISFLHARSARHRHLIDKYLLRLRSAGILQYLERKWISTQWPNSNERHLTFKTVEYAHVDVISLALVTMIFVSGFICVLENIWFQLESNWASKATVDPQVNRSDELLFNTFQFPAVKLDAITKRLWTTDVQNW